MSNDAKARAAQPPAIGPGGRHGNRFAETEYAKDFSWTMKRIGSYFAKEKKLIIGMLAAVLGSTLFGIYAPMLQSNAVDIIAGQRSGDLKTTILFMLGTYLLGPCMTGRYVYPFVCILPVLAGGLKAQAPADGE